MNTNKTYTVKGMVCHRCITTLQHILEQHELEVNDVSLGRVAVSFNPEKFNDTVFSNVISSLGFGLSVNKNNKVVEQVKSIVTNYFNQLDPLEGRPRFSDLMSDALHMSYDNISSIFAAHEKVTIENYIIAHRIELVKKLLNTTDLTLTEIAYRIGFSSVHHLSKQFKDVTGMTPSDFRTQISHKNHISNSGESIIMAGV